MSKRTATIVAAVLIAALVSVYLVAGSNGQSRGSALHPEMTGSSG